MSRIPGNRAHPPPQPVVGLRDALAALDPERFGARFLAGKRLKVAPGEEPLVAAGLLERRGAPCARVYPFFGRFIATDLLSYREPDQVFPLMFEQIYLVRNTSLRKGEEVLELCSGSGANCIAAAALAGSVLGVDISPRALAFAGFNRALNAPDRRIEFRRGSLFEPVEPGRAFDVILVNPPFEFVEPGRTFYLHSDGGEDGLEVVRACLAGAPRHLKPGGRFEIISFSPGSEDSPALIDLLEQAFPDSGIECHLLYDDPIEEHLRGGRSARAAWRKRLADAGHTRCYFLFCRVTIGAGRSLRLVAPHKEIERCRGIEREWR